MYEACIDGLAVCLGCFDCTVGLEGKRFKFKFKFKFKVKVKVVGFARQTRYFFLLA